MQEMGGAYGGRRYGLCRCLPPSAPIDWPAAHTGSSGRPRAATKRTAPADRKQNRDYRRLPESRAVGRTRGGPSARIFPPTTRATAGEHGLRAGVGPLRNNVIHATAHGTWAVTRRQRAEYGAGARASRRGERTKKARGEQKSNNTRWDRAQGHQKTQA